MNLHPLFVPDEPLPPYSYVPGKFPHPHRDPAGHSFGQSPPEAVALDPQAWRDCKAYLRGVDLFNHGYYWEAHESWEAVWNGFGRKGVEADFMKALIKLAAALVKAREGRSDGVARHAARAEQLLRGVQYRTGNSRSMMGFSFATLRSYAGTLRDEPTTFTDAGDEKVIRFDRFVLRPE